MSEFDLLDGLVPVSLFNKGKAKAIFDRVKKTDRVVVVKNNLPIAVILSLKEYSRMRFKCGEHPADTYSAQETFAGKGSSDSINSFNSAQEDDDEYCTVLDWDDDDPFFQSEFWAKYKGQKMDWEA